MEPFTLEKMQEIQKELQEKYKHKWTKLEPKTGRSQLLWMMIEAGEMADIIKKQGDEAIMTNAEIRSAFVEEMCDVLMYFNDVMLCYDVSPQELQKIYLAKHERNMKRW